MLLRDIRDFINLGHFDPIIQMIPLTMIPLSSAHCNYDDTTLMWISLMIVCLEGGWELQCQGGLSDKYYEINFSLKHTSFANYKTHSIGPRISVCFHLSWVCSFYVFCDIFSNIGIIIFSLKQSNSYTLLSSFMVAEVVMRLGWVRF